MPIPFALLSDLPQHLFLLLVLPEYLCWLLTCVNTSMQEYKEYHTDTEVHFQLFFTAAKLQEMLSGAGAHQKLKLVGKTSIGKTLL